MKINVRVKANARKNEIRQIDKNRYVVNVTAPPAEGRANEKVIELLAKYFHKPKRSVTFVAGRRGRDKILEIQ